MMNNWKEILEKSRDNYISVVQTISKMQKEIEKILFTMADSNLASNKKVSEFFEEWIKTQLNIRDAINEGLNKTVEKMFNNISDFFPLKKELEDIYKNIQESLEKYFEVFEGMENFIRKK
jgi:DNA anti-recombination protein RmuC